MLRNLTKFLKLLSIGAILYWTMFYVFMSPKNLTEINKPSQRLLLERHTNLDHPTIFCVILSQNKNLDIKAKSVYTSWGYKCSDYRLISLIPGHNLTTDRIEMKYENLFLVLKPEGLYEDKYENLTYKILFAFEDVFKLQPNFDWFLKADDDTFIFYDNLRDFVATKKPSDPITFGYDFKVIVPGGYHSGGGGYLLSNEAMKRLMLKWRHSMHLLQGPFKGVEDVEVASLLRTVNVSMGSSLDDKGRERFHVLNFMRYYTGNLTHWIHGYAKNPVKIVRD